MVKVIVINGAAQSGKDTFVEFCKEVKPHYVYSMSTVDFIKRIAEEVGWDGEKTPEARKYLSDLKDIFTKWLDASYKEVEKKVEALDLLIVQYWLMNDDIYLFVHCREPEEINKLVNNFGAKTVFIMRPGIEKVTTNHADLEVEDYDYDYFIVNDGNLDDLRTKAKLFMGAMRTGTNCYACGHHVNEDKDGYCYCPICDRIFRTMKYKEKSE